MEGRPDLTIYTDDNEITVSYDRWHGHFEQWADGTDERLFDDAYACVQAILTEHMAVAVRMKGDVWAGSQLIRRDEESPTPGPRQTVYVRSWLGTLDRVTHAA